MRAVPPSPAVPDPPLPSVGGERPHPGFGTGVELWLVRHGEVHGDWHGVAYGDLDVPLSDVGLASTAAAAEHLGALVLAAVLASPLERARRLGEALAARAGLELELEPDLREINRGAWQGQRVEALHAERAEEVEAFYADPWSFEGHGGENDRAVLTRVWPVLARALRLAGQGDGDARRIAVAAHYNVIRVAAAYAVGIPPARSFGLRVDPGRAVLLRDGRLGWELVHTNVVGPIALEDPGAREARDAGEEAAR